MILQTTNLNVNTTLEDQYEGEDGECNANDNNWIPIPNQLEEGYHMLIEETIEVDLSDDPRNPKVI